ncbi:MAG: xanthine dehydrogenase family protein molybdopterin-binding subunit [Deltaproteobacteria bacterium]|nr:xanthine dehydrogenase family protein molybdopterin-binding subunit [Deltaproteobacteria bacterium]
MSGEGMGMALEIVGQSVPRSDGQEKVAGQARYMDAIDLPGMLVGRVLRSTVPHGRLRRVDAEKARRVPGVVAVVTGESLRRDGRLNPYYGPALLDQPVLAIDKVLYVGDPVAAVAAVDEESALEALDLIEVEYEELPAVFEPLDAIAPGAPLLHEGELKPGGLFVDLTDVHPVPGTNICNHYVMKKGDGEAGFRHADIVIEQTFSIPETQHYPLEPHSVLAWVDPSGRIALYANTQQPFIVRAQLADIFQVPPSHIRIMVPYMGGAYGAKCYPKAEPIATVLAWFARRPVKLTFTREEVFLTITKHATVVKMKSGAMRDGTLVARKVECYLGTGAYAEIGPRVSKKMGTNGAGPYRIPHVQMDAYCIYTNKPPAGAFRGYGLPQVTWAFEQQMDTLARELRIDPVEIRLKNLFVDGDTFWYGERLNALGLRECLLKAAAAIRWGEPSQALPGKRRGKGLAIMLKTLTHGASIAFVKVDDDGTAKVLTSTVEMGQGSDTVLAQIAAEELGLPVERVSMAHPDTDFTPFDDKTSGSRSTVAMGKAVLLAAREARERLLELAAEQLEASVHDLEVRRGQVRVRGTDRALDVAQVVRAHFRSKGGTIMGRGEFHTKLAREEFWFAAAGAAEVEVDPETGEVRVLKYVGACDVGKAINPHLCQQQVLGGAVMGLGQTFSEEMVYDHGQLLNPSLINYKLPAFRDLPAQLEVILLETPYSEGPFGAKGVGESAVPPVAAAIGNALVDAIGVRLYELPITAEKVLKALEEAGGAGPVGAGEAR